MPIPLPNRIGLTEKEAKLYEILLNIGETDAARLIRETGYKRPTVYKSLYSMAEKGLITEIEKRGIAFFRPKPPQKLLELAETKYAELNRARNDVQAMLPELVSAFTLSTERPVVTTFEGVEGLKKVYKDMLATKQPINAALYTGEVRPELLKWLQGEFTDKRIELEIPVRSIVASGGWAEDYVRMNEKGFRETRMIDSEKYPLKHEVSIYGNKVAFIDFAADRKQIAVLIDHKQIAISMKAWFNLTWDQLI